VKRKSKSQVIKVLPLPEFKQNKPVIQCYKCKKLFEKSIMHRLKTLRDQYYCDPCKKSYRGKFKFMEK